MSTKPGISLLFLIVLSGSVIGQATHQFGTLPSINLNKNLPKEWGLNVNFQSRQVRLDESSNTKKNYDYVLSDFTLIASKSVGFNSKLAGGFLWRIREEMHIHRSIQQFTLVRKLRSLRLAHRLVTDQTFSPSDFTAFRLRYRTSIEIPLSGQSVDPREFYLKVNHEYLNSLQHGDYDLEIRIIPLLGMSLTDTNKLECGLDYRVNSFVKGSADHTYWLNINWFHKL